MLNPYKVARRLLASNANPVEVYDALERIVTRRYEAGQHTFRLDHVSNVMMAIAEMVN